MKKKSLLVSTIALATASAMVFSPVSYKVLDKAAAAPASEDVIKASATLQAVFAELNDDSKLSTAYNAMLTQANADIANINIQQDFPNLYAHTNANGQTTAVNTALKALLSQIVSDYSSSSTNLDDLSSDLHNAIADLNDALAITGNDVITIDDVAKLLVKLEAQALIDIRTFVPTEDGLVSTAVDVLTNVLSNEWNTSTNKVVVELKKIYTTFAAFKSDVDTYKANLEAELSVTDKDKYKSGALALATSYLKYQLKQPGNTNPLTGYYKTGAIFSHTNFNLLGFTGFPVSALEWSSSVGTASVVAGRVTVNLTGVALPATVEVTATLKSGAHIPTQLAGVELFKQTITYSDTGTGVVEVDVPLQLVADAQAKANAITGAVSSYLEASPELRNNAERFGLQSVIENGLRSALEVPAANAVTNNAGVSTFSPTITQLETIYNQQLNPVLNAAKNTIADQDVDIEILPVLTFNIGVVTNGQVNLNKALIDSLLAKGVSSVGVKTGDTVIEVPLFQLTGAATIKISKSSDNVYSISVVDTAGNELTAFEKQYRVTLPVQGNVKPSAVTVAQLKTGSVTHIGGAYVSETDTITFYANQLGDYTVVENEPQFNDIANLDWAETHIQLLANQGFLLGKSDGQFDPKGTVTRAEFTAMIVRSFNLSLDGTGVDFADVSSDAWYHGAVEAAVAYGIVSGRNASTFDPNAHITRDEMATMAANALREISHYTPALNPQEVISQFADSGSVVPAHAAGVALLADEEIVQGRPDGSFDPKGNASRAEAAVIILNAISQRI